MRRAVWIGDFSHDLKSKIVKNIIIFYSFLNYIAMDAMKSKLDRNDFLLGVTTAMGVIEYIFVGNVFL